MGGPVRKMGKPALTDSLKAQRERPAHPRREAPTSRTSSRRRPADSESLPPVDPESPKPSAPSRTTAPCSPELQRSCPLTRELLRHQRRVAHQKSFINEQSHALRAHLHAVMGYAGLVLRQTGDCLPKQQAENLNKLLTGAEALKNAINRLEEFPY